MELLVLLQTEIQAKDRQRGKQHEVWKDCFAMMQYRTGTFTLQKLVYLHENSVRGKWRLCATSLESPHSSARFYINYGQRLFPVRDYRDFITWETLYD